MPELFIDDIRQINSNLWYDRNKTFNCAWVVQRLQVSFMHTDKTFTLLTDVASKTMAVASCAIPSKHMKEKEKNQSCCAETLSS